jgi:hypothetical protein
MLFLCKKASTSHLMRPGSSAPSFRGVMGAAEPAAGLTAGSDPRLAHGDLTGDGLGGIAVGVRREAGLAAELDPERGGS